MNVRGSKSASRPLLAGVTQGAVLGPVLYSIFTSNLPSHRRSTSYHCTRHCISVQFESWSAERDIAVNLVKFQHATISLNMNTYRLTVDGTPIKHFNTAKFLGLWRGCLPVKRREK